MTNSVASNQQNVSITIRLITDSTGAPAEGVTAATGGHAIWYRRTASAVVTDAGAAGNLTALTDAHSDWDFDEIRDGYYRVDFPDAAFVSGASKVLCGMDATGISCVAQEVSIDPGLKFQGNAASVTSTTTTFPSPTDVYDGDFIYVVDGTGIGQTRLITSVSGLQATHAAWDTNISVGSTIVLIAGDETIGDGGVNVDTTVSSRSTITQAEVNSQADLALTDIGLDHLMSSAVTDPDIADDSVIAQLASSTGDWADFDNTTDSLQAIRDAGDSGWSTAGAAIATGTSDSGSTTTMVDSARTEADNDYWKGAFIHFTSGNIAGQVRLITSFNAGSNTTTFSPATTQAVTTQNYEIITAAGSDLRLWNGTTPSNLVSGAVDASVSNMVTDAITAGSLSGAAITKMFETVLTESYATDGAEGTVSQILYAVQQFLLDADLSGTTLTVRQLDGTTQAYILTVDNATTPTDKNRTA